LGSFVSPAEVHLQARRYAGIGTRVLVVLALLLLLLLVTLPLLGLILRVPPLRLVARLGDPAILQALKLSLVTSLSATAIVIVLGLPAAYLLARREFRGKRLAEALVDLPMVLPPTVAGLALLLALGRNGLAGGALDFVGVRLPFTTLGVIVAQAFMAVPFFIGPARAGFAAVDERLVDAATTLRASESFRFFRVMVPLAFPSLLAGAAMSCARALGEFGATITFAGNLPGFTQTMPLAVYDAMQSDLEAAIAMAVLLTIMALGLLLLLRQAPTIFLRASRAPR
jgi:molybdate transport system permease protein